MLRNIAANQRAKLLRKLPTQGGAGVPDQPLRIGDPLHGGGRHQLARQQISAVYLLAQ